MEIRQHETQKGTIVISNPTAEATKLAKQMAKNATIRPNGDIVTFSAWRRDFEKLGATFVKPEPPAQPAENEIKRALIAKIKQYRAENVEMETHLAKLNDKSDRLGMVRVELHSEIRANLKRIENLEKQLAGIPTSEPVTDEQIALMDYVLSDAYNDD